MIASAYHPTTWTDTMLRDALCGLVPDDVEAMSRDELIAAIPLASEAFEQIVMRLLSIDMVMNGHEDGRPVGVLNP